MSTLYNSLRQVQFLSLFWLRPELWHMLQQLFHPKPF